MRGLGGMREWFAVEEEGKARGSKALAEWRGGTECMKRFSAVFE